MESSFDRVGAAFVATAVVVIGYYVWWRWSESTRVKNFVRGSSSDRLPSPMPALPRWCGFLGGHSLLLQPLTRVAQFERWAEELGGDYELHIEGTRVVIVTAPSDIRRILNLRPTTFKRGIRPDELTWALQEVGIKDSMGFTEGKVWGRSRRLVSPYINGHNFVTLLPVVAKIGERFLGIVGNKADKGEIMKAKDTFARFTHDVIAMVGFGLDTGSIMATAERPCHSYDFIRVSTSACIRLAKMPLDVWGWKFLPMLSWVRNAKKHVRLMENVIQGAMDAVRLEPKAPGAASKGSIDTSAGGNLLRKLAGALHGKGRSGRKTLSTREVMDEATSLLIAGTESTSLTLCWAMYYLSKSPEAFLRCRAEALETAPMSDGMVSTGEQLSKLEFCSAVFKEVLRLRMPAPVLMFHGTEDFTLKNGFVVEEGTGIIVLLRAAGVSDEWFTRGKEFVPERWIEAEREEALLGKGAAGDTKGTVAHAAEAYLAFGHGPRLCPGQDMAKAEGAMMIAAICARFDVSVAPGQVHAPEETSTVATGPQEFGMIFSRRKG